MPRRRRRGGVRALWAPVPVDITLDKVRPVPGWLLLKEMFVNDSHAVPDTDVVLAISVASAQNTMHAEVMAVHPDTGKELGVRAGDVVIYREYSGGRWSFNGERALLTQVRDILAKVR